MSSTKAGNIEIQKPDESQKEVDERETDSIRQPTEREPRIRKPTEKSLQFRLETKENELKKIYKRLEQQICRTNIMIDEPYPDIDKVREEYKTWMNLYESYCIEHNKFCDLLTEDQHVEYYSQIFAHQDSTLRKFKMKILTWLAEHTRLPNHGSRSQSTRSEKTHTTHKSRSSRSSHKTGSSTHSSVSAARFREEQRKLELTVEKAALRKRQELQIAKLKLKEAELQIEQEQEELQMSIELDKATIKCKALKEIEEKKGIENGGNPKQRSYWRKLSYITKTDERNLGSPSTSNRVCTCYTYLTSRNINTRFVFNIYS